jgi:DNA primase
MEVIMFNDTQLLAAKATDLSALIERVLGEPKSKKWCCPFHDDKTPSLTIFFDNTGIQRFKCFGCGETGDAIDWLRKIQHIDFRTAVGQLTGDIIDLTQLPNSLERLNSIRAKQRQEREAVKDKVRCLGSKVAEYKAMGSEGSFYWHGQGLSDMIIDYYNLGYTPHCPLYSDSPSFVIPIYQNKELVSIRHRLQYPNGSVSRLKYSM